MLRTPWINLSALGAVALATVLVAAKNIDRQGAVTTRLLNVSYDPTRELYQELNAKFVAVYQEQTGKKVKIEQSHGGSSRQARAVIDGLAADVVTLALYSDTDSLRKRGLVAEGWSTRLPHDSLPYTSTIVFVVRQSNPMHIRDWPDLVQPGVAIVTPNPRTSGNGKLSFLAAWGSVIHAGGDEARARAFVTQLYAHVAMANSGAREAADAFSLEKIGDVHLTWENEALREAGESAGELEIVYPTVSIRAEPYVAWVDANVDRRGTKTEARAYLEFLYTREAQEIIAKHGYRPIDPDVLREHARSLPPMELFSITAIAKDWEDAAQKFFSENGVFDSLASAGSR
jgi:sulfate/thiosulfate-binding protein